MPHLNDTLKTKIKQVPELKNKSTKRHLKKMKSKRAGLRRMRKQLGRILTVIADCQTLKKHKSKEHCHDKMKKYILKFMKGASTNRFKYIL